MPISEAGNPVRDALAELVAVEDLKMSLAQASHHAARFPTDENYAVIDSLSTDIGRRRAARGSFPARKQYGANRREISLGTDDSTHLTLDQ